MQFREAVCKGPGTYLGDPRGGQAANNAILELVGNVIERMKRTIRFEYITVTSNDVRIAAHDIGRGKGFGWGRHVRRSGHCCVACSLDKIQKTRAVEPIMLGPPQSKTF